MYKKKLVLGILGPTATGKTDLACNIANIAPVQIISVDSSMVYRGMDIGTAKPSKKILEKYPHKLINIRDPQESYSAGDFLEDALVSIRDSLNCGKTPLLVGGTMLYFHVLQNGLSQLPKRNTDIREELAKRAKKLGWESLHAELAEIDPESFQKIKPTDKQRIQRALEVYSLTNKPLGSFQLSKPNYEFEIKLFGIVPSERSIIHQNIENRFKDMLKMGLIEEVNKLYETPGLCLDLPSIRSVGYRQIWQYLSGELTYNEMVQQATAATRQLAKRQLTWLRRWDDINIFDNIHGLQEEIIKNCL
ncbi:MAG: tRNA (adenosine(37)-N6)-dimethylallyltransferase MiaA [Legionellales bacterium]|nr:tRNA (adenosine(37)-N6)-dimethylallyltransferase MiaA [Legionellales bacterium]